jgi:signal transduction histidine kinase
VSVRDDGVGFDIHEVRGTGLVNMRDRVTAVGGELDVASASGQGVVVTGSVPIAD